MARLVDVVTQPPRHVIDQAEAAAFARDTLVRTRPQLAHLMPVFEHAGVATRRLCQPVAWYRERHTLADASAVYIAAATELCTAATRRLLDRHGLAPAAIDRVFYVNTTGLATPSIDARLIGALGLRHDIARTPIWGLGCAGGVAGLAHACEYVAARPRARALVCCVELCSLTLMLDDVSPSNMVALALFADGAAAALVAGDEAARETGDRGLEIVDSRTRLYPDSLDIMGWNVVASGLQVVFDRRIPSVVARHARGELDELLSAHGLALADVAAFLYHPGGAKVLAAYEDAYGLTPQHFHYSHDTLRDSGNMSSVTVSYVLERFLADPARARTGHAVIAALGPGFSSNTLLAKLGS